MTKVKLENGKWVDINSPAGHKIIMKVTANYRRWKTKQVIGGKDFKRMREIELKKKVTSDEVHEFAKLHKKLYGFTEPPMNWKR